MQVLQKSGQKVEKLDKTMLDHHIAELDFQIYHQLGEIMHNETFQQVESVWRGFKGLVDKAVTTGQAHKSTEFKWYKINDAGQEVEYFNTKLENVKVNPLMHDIKAPSFEKHNHLERVELRYETITWTYKDGNIIHYHSFRSLERTRHGVSHEWAVFPCPHFCFC